MSDGTWPPAGPLTDWALEKLSEMGEPAARAMQAAQDKSKTTGDDMLTMGEFRGWMDTDAPNASDDDVLLMYGRVARMERREEVAYCVTEGVRKGVVVLCYGFAWGRQSTAVALWGCPPSVDFAVLRPFVAPARPWASLGEKRPGIVDAMPWLPDLPESCDDRNHFTCRAMSLDTYFAHFADRIDRRTLLMREPVEAT